MSDSTNGYHISFFKPTTPRARFNRQIVIWLASIWAVAIFGFQILLKIVEKPTPEPAYVTFQNIWAKIENGSSDIAEIQEFGQVSLSVLGKIDITDGEKIVLGNALSWSLYNLTADSAKTALIERIQNFEKIESEIKNISDPEYIQLRNGLTEDLSLVLNLKATDVRTKILPLELSSGNMLSLTEDSRYNLPAIMKKYLVHNQSFLTDSRFLGFPFHYFYTAVFLLILFVGLCWVYCLRADYRDKILGIEE